MRVLLDKIKKIWAANPILVLVGIALTISLLLILWSAIRKAFNYTVNVVKGAASGLTTDEAKAISQSIFSEVNKMFTDEDVIVDIVKDLTLADYYKVQAQFGIQPYSSTFDNFDSLTGTDANLTEVLNDTLSTNDKEKIKEVSPWLPIA